MLVLTELLSPFDEVLGLRRRTFDNELGTLNEHELRVLHQRVARAHDLRLDVLALEQARRLIERMRAREP